MNKYKFAFLILHYITSEDTINCVDSILNKCNKSNFDIVIVDNHSNNESVDILKKKYKKYNNIYIIENEKNLGFANGNNTGFSFIKKNLNSDFIIMCNSDTYLLQENFLKLIAKEYNYSNFSVLGPKILLRNSKVNPVKLNVPSKKELKKKIIDYKLEYITSLLYIFKPYISIRRKLKRSISKNKNVKNKIANTDKRYENIVLHGSFLIFSPIYINMFDGLDNRTFLYKEEELLALRLKKNNMKSIYNPEIQIFHNEDGSTNAITNSNRKKRLFINKYLIKSTKILIDEL